ncbi:MAG: T9SS type A sorting domain-containing protein [Bacteroidota bacterium]
MATNPWSEDENFAPDLGIELVVYPNPSNGIFSLDIKKEDFIQETYKVRVVNIVGQTVASKEIETNMETKFDLSTLPKGFYFVRVEVGKQEVVKRIVLR